MSSREYKIAVIGSVVINKPAFIIRFAYGHFVEGNDPSSCDRYRKSCVIDGEQCTIDIADVSAEEEENSAAFLDQYIRSNQGFVLTYSVASRDSFGFMSELHERIQRVQGPESVPIALVGSDCDQVGSRQVTRGQGEELARRLGCPFFEVSVRNNIRVEDPFIAVVRGINAHSSPETEPVRERESIKDALKKRRDRKKEERRKRKEKEEEEEEEERRKEEKRTAAKPERPDVYKVVTLGSTAAGKSAIVIRYISGHFISEYDPSLVDSYNKDLEVNGEQYKLEVIDIVGAEEYNSVLDEYRKEAHGFLLVYAVNSLRSFEEVKAIYKHALDVREGEGFPVVLVGNMCDLNDSRIVTTEQGEELAKELGCPFIEVSAKENVNIDELFALLVMKMNAYYPLPSDEPKEKGNKLFKFFGRK